MNVALTRLSLFSSVLLAVAVLPSFGCQKADAQHAENRDSGALRTISVEVIGAYRDADVEFVVENLKEIFSDAPEWSSSGTGASNTLTFEARSRSNAQTIANQIQFGTETRIRGQSIRVIFDQTKQVPGPARSAAFQPHQPVADALGPALDASRGDYVDALKSIGASVRQNGTQIVELRMPPFKTNDLTLAWIAKLPSLKKLDLSICGDVTDEGVRNLTALSELEDLHLFGTRVGNRGQAHLGKFKKLRTLGLSGLGTEQGLEYLSELTSLETLKIGYGNGYPVTSAGLQHLSTLKNLRILQLDGCQVGDDGMKVLGGFHHLTDLSFNHGSMTSDGLVHLNELTQLEKLSLKDCKLVDDRGLAELDHGSKLKVLNLSGTKISDQGLRDHISRLRQLTFLSLAGTKITDNCIDHLSSLSKLYSLSIADTAITDTGFQKLAPLPLLRALDVSNTAIGDQSAQHIATFPLLTSVLASDTQISDLGLQNLASMHQLRALYLNGTRITDNGMHSLSDLSELNRIAVKNTAVTQVGLRALHSPKLREIIVDPSQASWVQVQNILDRPR